MLLQRLPGSITTPGAPTSLREGKTRGRAGGYCARGTEGGRGTLGTSQGPGGWLHPFAPFTQLDGN